MKDTLHITSGDCAGGNLAQAELGGDVLVWHDLLYEGPRNPGWPTPATLAARAAFLEEHTGGGLTRAFVRQTLDDQYRRLSAAGAYAHRVLWFDACVFDQAMLAHLLTCLAHCGVTQADLLCVGDFPGVVPYDGLGQLTPAQLASLYGQRHPVTPAQFAYAQVVDHAFATQDLAALNALAHTHVGAAPLPFVPAAAARWLLEQPAPATGLGRLATLALDAIRAGCTAPPALFRAVAAADTHPQYWGDTTLWGTVNALAARTPPLVRITGPAPRLPQWPGQGDLTQFTLTAV